MNLSGIALNGLDLAQASLQQTAGRLSRNALPSPDGEPVDTVDLGTAMVDLLAARQAFAVNLKLLKTADQMERQAIDLLA